MTRKEYFEKVEILIAFHYYIRIYQVALTDCQLGEADDYDLQIINDKNLIAIANLLFDNKELLDFHRSD